MPTLVKRLSPVIVVSTALILLAAYLCRKPSALPACGRSQGTPPVRCCRFRLWHVGPAIAVISVLLTVLVDSLCPGPSSPPVHGRALEVSSISSRGGLRILEPAVLGATPQPVPVLRSRLVGPPSPDPVLLAVARIVPTPTPTPLPTAAPPEAGAAVVLRNLGVFRVTGYSDSPFLNGTDGRGITKSGAKTHWGCVAVDPKVLPLGTRLVIENYEGTVFTALDTGGGITGRWIDIWFPDDDSALQHGLRELAVAIVAGN